MVPARTVQLLLVLAFLVIGGLGPAAAGDFAGLVAALDVKSYSKKAKAVEALAASGHPRAAAVLEALGEGHLLIRSDEGRIVILADTAGGQQLSDALTGADLGAAPESGLTKIKVNNKVRRAIRAAMGSLTLLSPDPEVRAIAADAVFRSADARALDTLDQAIARETLPDLKARLVQARAAVVLAGDAPDAEKLAAIETLRARGDREVLSLLAGVGQGGDPVARAAAAAAAEIEADLELWQGVQNVIYGLSLGSVLLLAAIGLAITFGVMGVINMAHGEMVMIGAYVTFLVQDVIRDTAPAFFDASLFLPSRSPSSLPARWASGSNGASSGCSTAVPSRLCWQPGAYL